jgi:predicted DNA-binding protein
VHRTQIFLPEDLHQQLKLEAKHLNTTISDVVRQIIEEGLNKKDRHEAEQGINTLLRMTVDD